MINFFETLTEVLKADERFFTENGTLLRNKVCESALNMDAGLIRLLLGNAETKKRFFTEVNGTLVFDKVGFGWVVSNRQFLPDSYTRFKNRIGLTDSRGDLISASGDVVLSFPYKDCVLEGGQSRDDQKRDEVFYNVTLAPNEVDRLLNPKVLVGARRYTASGVEENVTFDDTDNLIIKGNNLLVIASLLKRYEGKIKCICIDPPYNTGAGEFGYNDHFNHSTWLVFMKTRLEVSRRLLSHNGTIFIFCDDTEQAYLRILTDEIFGRDSFIQTIIWRNCDNSNNDARQFSQDHNYILVYSKNPKWESLKLDRAPEQAKHYKNPDNDPRGPWFDGNPVNSPSPRPNLIYTLTAPNGNVIDPPANGWRWDEKELRRRMETGEIRFNADHTNIVRRTYLNEQAGLPPSSLWDIREACMWTDLEDTGHTRQAKYEQKKLYPGVTTSSLFKTPKPERIIGKILRTATLEGDIVIDFFGGSGTTGAVAHKMKRRYILCEQMDYIDDFIVERMKKVVEGEQGGISKAVEWEGGGSFIYCELAKVNQRFADEAASANTGADLAALLERVLATGFISSKVNPAEIAGAAADFEALSIKDKKRFILELLDKNMLYVNLCDLDDEEYGISGADKAFTGSFYGLEGKQDVSFSTDGFDP